MRFGTKKAPDQELFYAYVLILKCINLYQMYIYLCVAVFKTISDGHRAHIVGVAYLQPASFAFSSF